MGPIAPFSLALCNSVELDWPIEGFKSLITRGKVKRSFYNDGFSPVHVGTWEAGLYVSEDLSNSGDAWLAPGSRTWTG